MCLLFFQAGHWLGGLITAVVYYLGYLLYCICYPIIVIVQWLASVAGWLVWLLSLPFLLLKLVIYYILYAIFWVITLIPWLIYRILLDLLALLGHTIALGLLIVIVCGIAAMAPGPGTVLALGTELSKENDGSPKVRRYRKRMPHRSRAARQNTRPPGK